MSAQQQSNTEAISVTTTTASSRRTISLVEDVNELREMVQGTYEDFQLALQQQQQQQGPAAAAGGNDSGDPSSLANEIQTSTAAFQLAMGAALKRINEISQDPSIVKQGQQQRTTGDNEEKEKEDAIDALGKLTWYLLRVAPFLSHSNQNMLVVRTSGALVESLDFDERLLTKEHCGFLFHNVSNFIRLREQCLLQQGPTSTAQLDALLQAFCPPLMVYFCKRLSVLKELRDEEKDISQALQVWRREIAMIRRLLLQAVEETILVAWVEEETATDNNDGSSKHKITYAQRIKFTGLYVNKDMVEWLRSETGTTGPLDSRFVQAGKFLEMSSWTGLVDTEEGIFTSSEDNAIKPHRIYQEGIPDDIPTLGGERIVICYRGRIERKMSGKVFPLIELNATKVGDCLTEIELNELQMKIQRSTNDEVENALSHQLHRGSNDQLIRQTILRLSMISSLSFDALN